MSQSLIERQRERERERTVLFVNACLCVVIGDRVKRRDRVLSDGCSCHQTAVAVAALAQYMRYIIEEKAAQSLHHPGFSDAR